MIGDGGSDGGVPHGGLLIRFADAVLGEDEAALAAARSDLVAAVGADGFVDAAAVVGAYEGLDRVADATGIPIDPERIEPTADLREQLGVNDFPGAPGKDA